MDKEDTVAYQEALDYLYKFVDYSLVRNFRYSPDKFDLSRMRRLLDLLGNPQAKYGVVHVAGTKGKGSTAALIASALRAQGYRVGFYTSPHLSDFAERFQVNGVPVSHAELVALVERIKPLVAQIERITWFEITTAIGFTWFAQMGVDLAVVEVGLGGRLDATNVVDPLVSVITSLSMDHMSVLGDTLEKIAREKAGIIKPGKPVVSAPQKEAARRVIEQAAQERGCRLYQAGQEFTFRLLEHSLQGQAVEVQEGPASAPEQVHIPLLGAHQAENAAIAFAALKVLDGLGVAVSDRAIREGFARVEWPGRFEILSAEPLLIVDGAHNADSAQKLHQTLEDYLPGRPVILIYGASEDKDVAGMLDALLPGVSEVIATQSVHPRAMDAGKIVTLVEQRGKPARSIMPLEQALETALASAGSDAVILATGSLFIAAAVRETWKKKEEQHER